MSEPTIITIPSIETDRTIMRAHALQDFDAYAAMWGDPAVTRFIGNPRTREEGWQRFLRHAGMWRMMGFGYWAVEDRTTGAFIGEAGFHELRRVMTPSIEGIPEAGWVLSPAVQGQGLASEIVAAVFAWADTAISAEKTVCIIDPANAASLRVARKAGFHDVTTTTYNDADIVLLERKVPGERG